MIKGIDISNWQASISLITHRPGFAILKATEGSTFVDKSCDRFAQQCISQAIPFGFYHFARPGSAAQQARFFRASTKGYERKGIPVLDFEDARCDNAWLEEFVREYHAITNVFPWIYMSSDFVNNRKYGTPFVRENCGLWLAGYPSRSTTYPANTTCPYRHDGWNLAAWQFSDRLGFGRLSVDGDIFYGDADAWNRYATGGDERRGDAPTGSKWHIARQVLNGVFGDGDARKESLGSRYNEVQECVNALVHESDARLATRVVSGQIGDGDERKFVLGGRYNAVQKQVNNILKR